MLSLKRALTKVQLLLSGKEKITIEKHIFKLDDREVYEEVSNDAIVLIHTITKAFESCLLFNMFAW